MSKFVVAVVAALALSVSVNSVASATEYKNEYCSETKATWQYKKVVTYKTVIEYKSEQEAYSKYVTEYDHCHKPYQVKKTFYRDVQVPVKKQIPVISWVKVKILHDAGYGY
jgi:hypothetical protein